jgi:hypothetical protein
MIKKEDIKINYNNVNYLLSVPELNYNQLKQLANKTGLSIRALIITAIQDYIERKLL